MMTRGQLREVNKLVAEYEHPGTLVQRRRDVGELLWYKYGVVVEELEGTSG